MASTHRQTHAHMYNPPMKKWYLTSFLFRNQKRNLTFLASAKSIRVTLCTQTFFPFFHCDKKDCVLGCLLQPTPAGERDLLAGSSPEPYFCAEETDEF